ncbi:MAG: hypothetical protein K2J25_04020, partial [Oscillospiraceae bacterium]|nr:hypothetical protein [Oscillospiraceae bacterium]
MIKFKIFRILAECSKKSKGIIKFLYWMLYFLLVVVLIEYFDMFRVQNGVIVFDMDYLHIAGMLIITAIFFEIDKNIQEHMVMLEKESNSKQESKQESKTEQKIKPKPEQQRNPEKNLPTENKIIPNEISQEVKPEISRQLKRAKKSENSVITEQYFRLNSFEQQAKGVQDFMNSCYHNTFRITLPEKIHGYTVPDEFQSFYLHFEFKDQTNHSLQEDVIQKQFHWQLQDFDGSDELVYLVEIPYYTQLDKNVRTSSDSEYFEIEVKFKLHGSEIQEFSIQIPEYQLSAFVMIKNKLKKLFFKQEPVKNRSSNATRLKTHFQETTRLNPMFT